ncbi:MAG: polysaccharide pyruvyl transferase family protein [Geobacteraceae bacterium]|nr:polysaccharide pyruvyl transferase family protein [Geobacteraceae bacterium]
MNKIGIITITRDENYGNRLQNYAVQEVIKKLGFAAETIINTTQNGFSSRKSFSTSISKFKPMYAMKVVNTRIRNNLLIKNDRDSFISSFLWKRAYTQKIAAVVQQRKDAFRQFNTTNIVFSNSKISQDNLNSIDLSEYDYFVCGSDQIWNPYYPQTSMIDFLSFAPEIKRVAYAPSFGVSHIPENMKNYYKKWLLGIPSLSVREERGAVIIKELTGRDATVLVDPTVMLSKEDWLNVAMKPAIDTDQKYILTYFLGNETSAYRKAIRNIAELYSWKVLNLADIRELENYAVDPSEFIYLINNAELVCTDSFHGAVISIIMRTHFIVFDRVEDGHSMSSRLETFLHKFVMKQRLFRNIKSYEDAFATDFNSVDRIISSEQNKAWNFLKSAIKQPAAN